MTFEETVNTVQEEIREILNNNVGKINNESTKQNVLSGIRSYLFNISNKLQYNNQPDIKIEIEGPFMTVNFFSKDGKRLETFGDLVYYMEYGVVPQ